MGKNPSKENFYARVRHLAGVDKSAVNENKNNGVGTLECFSRTDDGMAYGVVKENHHYYIKKSNKQGDNLNEADFAFIGGLENKGQFQYKSLGEAQKQLNFHVMGINEAFSLGGVYNKLDESTDESPTLDVKEDINTFLNKAIKKGKKNLAESTEKKFKSSLNTNSEASEKKGLMSEEATKAIQGALGLIKEEDEVTADSEQKEADRVANKSGKEKPQAPVNDSNAKSEAEKNTATGTKDNLKKEGGKNSMAVNQSDEVLKEGEEVLVTADSELDSEDSLANKDNAGKESAQAPINDENAKAEAEKRDAKGSAPEIETSGDEDIVAEGEVVGDPFKEKGKSGKDISTEDSDQADADRVDNKKDVEKAEADYNNHNQPEKGHKEEKGEELKPIASKKDIVAEGDDLSTADSELKADDSPANDTSDPTVSHGKSEIVADSDLKPEDSLANDAKTNLPNPVAEGVDNKKEEQPESDPFDDKEEAGDEKGDIVAEGDKEEQPESDPFKDKEEAGDEKGDIVAEEDLSTADSEIKPEDSPANEDGGNIDYDKGKLEDGTSLSMDDNAIAEDDDDGSAEVDAAAQAMDDLEISVDAEKEEAPAEEPVADEIPTEEPVTDVAPEGGEEAPVDAGIEGDDETLAGVEEPVEEPAGEEGGEEVPAEEPAGEEGGEDESDSAKEISKFVGKIGHEAQAEDHTSDEVKGWINQIVASFKNEIADMPVEDRKAMADKILKMQDGEGGEEAPAGEEDAESVATGLDKGAEDAIDAEVAELGGAEEAAVEEAACNECGTFENYMNSRGYSKEDLEECSSMEMGNLVSGYANAYKDGQNDGDMEGVAIYVTPDVAEELKGYGHSDFVEELEPFVKKIGENGVKFGHHEPMIAPEPEVEEVEVEKKSEDLEEAKDKDYFDTIKRALAGLQNIPNPTQDVLNLIKKYQQELGMSGSAPVKEEPQLGGGAEVMAAGVVKPESADMTVEEVSENEKKVRDYVRKKIEELAGKRKPSLQESEKSEKLKKLDEEIEKQWNHIRSQAK